MGAVGLMIGMLSCFGATGIKADYDCAPAERMAVCIQMPKLLPNVVDAFRNLQDADFGQVVVHCSCTALQQALVKAKKQLYCPKCKGSGQSWQKPTASHKVLKRKRTRVDRYTSQSVSVEEWEYSPVSVRLPCPHCGGQWTAYPSGIGRPFGDLSRMSRIERYKITGVVGQGVNPDFPTLLAALRDLTYEAFMVDPKARRAPLLRWHARNALQEAAFDRHAYAAKLSLDLLSRLRAAEARARPSMAPQQPAKPLLEFDRRRQTPRRIQPRPAVRRVRAVPPAGRLLSGPPAILPNVPPLEAGQPVVFIGQVADVANVKGNTFLLFRLYGHEEYLAVAFEGPCAAKKRHYRLVAAVIRNMEQAIPWATGVGAFALRDVDPDFRPSTRPPGTSAGKPDANGPERLATKKLKLARMFLANGLKTKAGAIAKEIVKTWPKTQAAQAAKDILSTLKRK